jgi:hypothetical protein
VSVVRFMMLMPWGRVGSNLLFAILRQSAPMKLMNENLNRLRTTDEQSAWFEDFYELDSQSPSSGYIGSKQAFRAIRDVNVMRRMIEENSVHIVRLRRDNHVKAAVSQIRAEIYAEQTKAETGVGMWAVKKGAKPLGSTEIDPDVLLKRIGIMVENQEALMAAFSQQDVLDIEYEEIQSSLDNVVTRLRVSLGLPSMPYRVPFEKATPNKLSDAIANFSEVRMRLAATPYADYLVDH